MDSSKHCPGFNDMKHLKAYIIECSDCGKEKEVFSDELNRKHTCSGCGKELDLSCHTSEAGI